MNVYEEEKSRNIIISFIVIKEVAYSAIKLIPVIKPPPQTPFFYDPCRNFKQILSKQGCPRTMILLCIMPITLFQLVHLSTRIGQAGSILSFQN